MDPRQDGRPALAVVSLAIVAWAGWRVIATPQPLLGTLLIVGGVIIAVASIPTGALAFALADPLARRLDGFAGPLAVAFGLALVGWVMTTLLAPSVAATVGVAGALLALVAFAVVLPLTVGSIVADRREVPFRTILLGWPGSLVAGVLLFLAPGGEGVDFLRYNATFLEEPVRSLVFATIAAVVLLGPAAVAVAVAAARGRDRSVAS